MSLPLTDNFSPEVLRAMERWPDVPRCCGWLALDTRGHWLIKNQRITHARTVAFLNRHYAQDGEGRWYVQNGPQQAFVDLAYTPWIFRLSGEGQFVTHTGLCCLQPQTVYSDDEGNLLLLGEMGLGLIDDRDLDPITEMFEFLSDEVVAGCRYQGRLLPLQTLRRAGVSRTFGFDPTPRFDA